ncbi:MAG: VWA domain-containing protein [Candidatus Kapabacteria bacterium]|nr:VWA domain-containing protein [Candidatus Kapabacteria bacterium]
MKTQQNYPIHKGMFRLSTLIADTTQQIHNQKSITDNGNPLRVSGRACAATLSAPTRLRAPHGMVSVVVMMLVLIASTLTAQYGQVEPVITRCGSPRFLVSQGEANAFGLRSTNVTVNVVGVIADVNVRQVYVNNGATPVEATYIFPASTRAAVYGLTMTIGPRIVKAVIKEKQAARAEYTAAIQQGRTATLLDQIKPNVFQMQVGNIPAHDSVVVDMHYTEALELREGEYEFVYPGVVGPRYVSGVPSSEYDKVLNSSDLPKEVPGTFNIVTNISAGVPVAEVTSPSHSVKTSTLDGVSRALLSTPKKNSITSVSMAHNDVQNRDYVLRYRLTGRAIESGLLLYKGEKENFFMLMVQPPKNVEIPNIVPREFVFIVDVSGSMQGEPTRIASEMMNNLFKTLRPTDKFNIMMFSGGNMVFSPNSVEATPDNVKRAYGFLHSGYGGGGTELLPALKVALAMKAEPGYARSFIALTDGYVTVEREAFDLVRNNLNNANFYAFGIGTSVNRWLMEGLARAGNAESFIVTNLSEAPAMAEKFRQYIEAPVLTGVKVDWGNMNVYDVDPGTIPSATSKRPIVVYGKWKGDATGTLRLTGNAADGAYTFDVNIAAQPQLPEHAALKYLWARNRIKFIEDGMVGNWGYERAAQPDEQQLITSIGLNYNLLTKYTSFIAVDSTTPVKNDITKKKEDEKKQQNTNLLDSLKIGKLGGVVSDTTTNSNWNNYKPKVRKSLKDAVVREVEQPEPSKATINNSVGNTNTYQTSNTAANTYLWSVTGGAIASGQGTSQPKVKSKAIGAAAKPAPQQVTVTAQKENVDAKEVGKIKSVSAEPLATTRESAVSIATTQAGVQASGGGLVVRGSRNSDNKYLVDGHDVTDVVTGTLGTPASSAGANYTPTSSTFATEDVQVVTGNANAQYGNAVGGVVNTVMKTGKANNSSEARDAKGTTPTDSRNQTTTKVDEKHNPSKESLEQANSNAAPTFKSTTTNSIPTEQQPKTQGVTPPPPPTTTAVIPEAKPQTEPVKRPQTAVPQRTVAQSTTQSAPTLTQSVAVSSSANSSDGDEMNPLEPAMAPPRLYVGPVFGYSQSFQTSTFDMLNGTTQQVSSTGNGFMAGFSAEFLLGDPKSSKSSIIITTLYHSTPATFSTSGTVAAFKANSPDTTSALAEFLAERKVSRLTLGITYKFNLGNTPLVLMAGLNPSLILSNTLETKATLPGTAAWAANSTTTERMVTTGAMANTNKFHLGAQFGLGYEFILKKIFVVPSIWYNLGLTNTTISATNKLSSIDFVLSIRFAL